MLITMFPTIFPIFIFVVLCLRSKTEQAMFYVFSRMGIHLVHVSLPALEAAKLISSSLGIYRTRFAALVASGCLLGFF